MSVETVPHGARQPVVFLPEAAHSATPRLRHVLAPNPSPMTGPGTNTWILGHGGVSVIDPGPDLSAHLTAIMAALAPGETVSRIFVTHAHLDHSGGAAALARRTGAPVLAFGDAAAGRSERMAALARDGLTGGEGVDAAFRPDMTLADGERVEGDGWALTALHTPGHFGNHICLLAGPFAFTGDHVMGWSTSLVSPPDGDMAAYMRSLERLGGTGARIGLPGHGPAVPDLPARIAELTAHRRAREAAVLAALGDGPADAGSLARRIYTSLTPALLPAAARNVLAHLIDLTDRNLIAPEGPLTASVRFRRR